MPSGCRVGAASGSSRASSPTRSTTWPTRSPPAAGSWWRCRTWATGTTPAPGSASGHGSLVDTVAERLKPERPVRRASWPTASALGMEVLPLTGGDPPFPTLLRRLRDGGWSHCSADRDLTAPGRGALLRRRGTISCRPRRARGADRRGAAAGRALARGRPQPRPLPRRRSRFRRRSRSGERRSLWRPRRSPTSSRRDRCPPGGLAHAAATVAGRPGPRTPADQAPAAA